MQENIGGMPVEIVKKNIKNMHLYIKPPDGRILVTAPRSASKAAISGFIVSHAAWINKHRAQILAKFPSEPIAYNNGDTIFVMGHRFTLHVEPSSTQSSVKLTDNYAVLSVSNSATPQQRRRIMLEWYRELLRQEIERLLPKWEGISGLYCSSWQIRFMKTRWGSCNVSTRKIWLNLRLAEKPKECLEYVIMHELAHLSEPGHNSRFYSILDKFMPDWVTYRHTLNEFPSYI